MTTPKKPQKTSTARINGLQRVRKLASFCVDRYGANKPALKRLHSDCLSIPQVDHVDVGYYWGIFLRKSEEK